MGGRASHKLCQHRGRAHSNWVSNVSIGAGHTQTVSAWGPGTLKLCQHNYTCNCVAHSHQNLSGPIMQHQQGKEQGAGWGEDVVLPRHSSASCLERVCCCSCSLSMGITKLISRSRSDWSLYGKNPAERWGRKCWRWPDGGYQRMKTLPCSGQAGYLQSV